MHARELARRLWIISLLLLPSSRLFAEGLGRVLLRVVAQMPATPKPSRVLTTVPGCDAKVVPTTEDYGIVLVPNVVGAGAYVAQAKLEARKLIGVFKAPLGSDLSRAIVSAQEPKACAAVQRESRVMLFIVIDSSTSVPTVVGQDAASVSRALREAELTLSARQAFDEDVRAGLAASQEPKGGSRVPIGSPVVVTFSMGAPPVVVPNVGDSTREAAERTIAGASLRVGEVDTVNSASGFGLVVRQEPSAGATAPRGTRVHLDIGRRDPEAPVRVPRLLTMTIPRATTLLDALRLRLHMDGARPDAAPESTIVQQDPAPGEGAKPGSEVHVVIAAPLPPDSVAIPNIVGLTPDSAAAILRNSRLSMGAQLDGGQGTAGTVGAQDPVAGTKDTVGAPVAIAIVPQRTIDSTDVPNVTQLLADSAIALLRRARLNLRLTDRHANSEPWDWTVIGQRPKAGERVPVRSTVRLTVEHVSPFVIVPNVVNNLAGEAARLAGTAGLALNVRQRRFAFYLRETVLAQHVTAGDSVLRGSQIPVDMSRPLTWPLAATVPLLGLATAGVGKWIRRPKIPLSFRVDPVVGELPRPSVDLPARGNLTGPTLSLEFGVDGVRTTLDNLNGSITLDGGHDA